MLLQEYSRNRSSFWEYDYLAPAEKNTEQVGDKYLPRQIISHLWANYTQRWALIKVSRPPSTHHPLWMCFSWSPLDLFGSPVQPRASHRAAKQTQVCPLCKNDRGTINPLAKGPLTFIISVWLGKNATLDSQGALLLSGLVLSWFLQLNFSALTLLTASFSYSENQHQINTDSISFHNTHSYFYS